MSEVEQRPRLTKGGSRQHRSQLESLRIHFVEIFFYLRNKKHVLCFYQVIETRVEV